MNATQDIEQTATQTVSLIKDFIDLLKEVPEFEPKQLKHRDDTGGLETVDVYSRVKGLRPKIQDVHQKLLKHETQWDASWSSPEDESGDQVSLLLHHLIFPLLDSLGRCYDYLDRLPNPAPQRRKKISDKPIPPIGMLSLQNYTDIACLLEFLVCTALIPSIEPNILTSVQERATYLLPKSLAGRIPRQALVWGTAVQQSKSVRSDLSTTINLLTKLVLLDRFRPMLLPRHFTDILAGLFQIEHVDPNTSLELVRSKVLEDPSVDSTAKARAFQTLLLQGTRTPSWLRKRVSSLLLEMAQTDLPSIIRVFVQAAPGDKSAASLRLARVITMDTSEIHLTAICKQLISILTQLSSEDVALSELYEKGLSPEYQAFAHFVWAVLEQLDREQIESYFLTLIKEFVSGVPDDSRVVGVHRMVRLIGSLFISFPSTFSKPSILLDITLLSLTISIYKLTVLQLLFRLASVKTVSKSSLKDDSTFLVRMISLSLTRVHESSDKEENLIDSFAFASVAALCTTPFDEVRAFHSATDETVEDSVRVTKLEEYTATEAVGDIQSRSATLVAELLSSGKDGDEMVEGSSRLPAILFQILLVGYLQSMKSEQSTSSAWGIVSMTVLPLLLERVSLEHIFFSSKDTVPLLQTMGLVFRAVSGSSLPHGDIQENNLPKEDSLLSLFENQAHHYFASAGVREYDSYFAQNLDASDMLSLCEILINILVAILELGSLQRGVEEEKALSALSSDLKFILESDEGYFRLAASDRDRLIQVQDIASHCMALIASRQADSSKGDECRSRTLTKLEACLDDLSATEPPLRARGVARLRHIAFTLLENENSKREEKRLVQLVEDTESKEDDLSLETIIALLVDALSDRESYVYLAAISTLSYILEKIPPSLFAAASRSILVGRLKLHSTRAEKDLSIEQRIKLTEALAISIRRMAIIDTGLESAIDLLLTGKNQVERQDENEDEEFMVQKATVEYFGSPPYERIDEAFREETASNLEIRLNTGGPLFGLEESDVLRAAMINFSVELVLKADIHFMARHGTRFVRCATDAIRLDASRPVRRAGATLARELYQVLVQEQEEFVASVEQGFDKKCPFALVMAKGGEEELEAALRRCASAFDSKDLARTHDRVDDFVTVERCREALELRNEVYAGGILAIAKAMVANDKTDRTEDMVKNLLRKGQNESN